MQIPVYFFRVMNKHLLDKTQELCVHVRVLIVGLTH